MIRLTVRHLGGLWSREDHRMQELTFGFKTSQQFMSVDTLRQVWTLVDEGGFDSCWVFDHFTALGPDASGDIFEAWALLAALAERTRRVRIGCMVTGNTYRHPTVLAKMAVTVDHLSGGRLDMGLGVGGHHGDLGLPTAPPGVLYDRLSEAWQVMTELWHEPTTTFHGEHYRLDGALANPKPIQRPHPPLWFGTSGERRGLRFAAEHADVWVSGALPGTPIDEPVRLSQLLDRRCEEVGRDPATLRRAAQFPLPADRDEALQMVEGYVRAGFRELVIMLFDRGPAAVGAAEAAVELLPKLRGVG
jgi:alkanesulfonate monooxygenase SsuD/methylene tetrahydromethanopterin reductase-like flavin-dependent oxidoreductase (luciferase family)